MLLGLAAFVMLLGLGVAGLAWVSRELGAEPIWVVVTKVPAPFHVTTTAAPLHFRESGFQDPFYELLFPVADADAFLKENGLTKGESAPAMTDLAPVKASSAFELDGFASDTLSRSGQLWQVNGRSWVYLVAFGT